MFDEVEYTDKDGNKQTEFVPASGSTSIYGFYETERGGVYFYGEDHMRVVGAYQVDEDEKFSGSKDGVVGYNFTSDGKAEPLNGKYTLAQNARTRYYVDGKVQTGNNFRYDAPDGNVYRVTSEGDITASYVDTGFPVAFTESAQLTADKYTNLRTNNMDGLTLDVGRYFGGNTSLNDATNTANQIFSIGNAGKNSLSAKTVVENGTDKALQLTFHDSTMDALFDFTAIQPGDGGSMVIEYDLRLGDDWNQYISVSPQVKNSSTWTGGGTLFSIDRSGALYSNGKLITVLGNDYVRVAYVLKKADTWVFDLYINGVLCSTKNN